MKFEVGDLWLLARHENKGVYREFDNKGYNKWIQQTGMGTPMEPTLVPSFGQDIKSPEDIPLIEECVVIVDSEQSIDLIHDRNKIGGLKYEIEVVKVMDKKGKIKTVNVKSLRKRL